MQQSDWLDYFRAVHGREPSVQEMAQAFEQGEFVKEEMAKDEVEMTTAHEGVGESSQVNQEWSPPFTSAGPQAGGLAGSQTKTHLIMIGCGMIMPLLRGLTDVFWHLLYGSDTLTWVANGFLWVVLAFVLSLLGLLPVLINKTPHKWLLFGISIAVGIFTRGLAYLLGTLGILAPISGFISFIVWVVLLVISIKLNQKQNQEHQRQLLNSLTGTDDQAKV